MANNFSDIQQGANALIDGIDAKVKELHASIGALNTNITTLLKAKPSSGGLNEQLGKTKTYIDQVEAASNKIISLEKKKQSEMDKLWAKRQKQIDDEAKAEQKKSADYIKAEREVEATRKRATAARLKEQASIQSNREALQKQKAIYLEINRPYRQLIENHKKSKKALQDATTQYGKHSVQTKKAQREYDRLSKKVNQANRATSNFAKGGLRSMAGGFKNLLAAFGVIGGLTIFANQIKSAFNLARKLDSLNFTMKAVIENSEVLERTQMFLTQTAEQYGASIVTLTERYNKFYTAARQSGVTLEDTEQIFKSFTKSAGFLGLRSHELEGVFLALEQMLSKGKVTTEELRRQLGERLPGAFGVMADTVNKLNPDIEVTVEVLDQMLKKGQILSAEVLPEFARQYEKAIGVDQKNRVETLNASIERLSNVWVAFVGEVTNGEGAISKTLVAIIDFTTDVVKGFELMSLSYDKYLNKLKGDVIANEYQKAADALKNFTIADDDLVIKELKRYDDLAVKAKKRIAYLKKQNELLKGSKGANQNRRNKEEIEGLIASLGFYEGNIKAIEEWLKETEKVIDKDGKSLDGKRRLSDVMLDLKNAQEELTKSTKEEAPAILANIMALNDEKKAWELKNKEKEKGIPIIKDTIGWYNKEISKLKELQTNTANTTKKYKDYQSQIEDLEDKIKLLIGAQEKLNRALSGEGLDMSGFMNDLVLGFESWANANPGEPLEKLGKTLEELEDQLKDFFEGFQDDFFSDLGFDKLNEIFIKIDEDGNTMFQNLMEAADTTGEKFAVVFNGITEVVQEAFAFINQQQEAQFDAEYARLEKEKDIAIQFAGESSSAKEEIERQYEEKRRNIQSKQAKAEKEAAIFNSFINTAQAVVSTMANVGLPGALPFMIATAALGAAQIAMIAAQPLPEFFRGTMNAPEGWASVDEKRPEIHTDRLGNIKSTGENKANHRWLSAGDKIYSSHEEYFKKELGSTLEGNDILPYKEMLKTSTPVVNINSGGIKKEDFVREISRLGEKIMSKETSVTNIDKNGFYTGVRKRGVETERQNSILKLKGGIV
jgi:tape measure domain-containing protein